MSDAGGNPTSMVIAIVLAALALLVLDAMVAHPILINRPIVVTGKGVRLCRPPERVLEILP